MANSKVTIHHNKPVGIGLMPLNLEEHKTEGLGVKLIQKRGLTEHSFGFIIAEDLLNKAGYFKVVSEEVK